MSGLYSMQTGDWWQAAVESAGVPRELLPAIREIGEPIGRLHPKLARRWGMANVPVVAGANDQTAAALGVGLTEPGEVTLGIGTALAAFQVVDAAAPMDSRLLRGPYFGGLQYRMGLCGTSGAAVLWARELLAPGQELDGLIEEVLSVEPGCGGLRADPCFEGEGVSSGALVGLSLQHERRHVFRAILEGIACAAREQLEILAAPARVFVTGGGATCDGWLQMLADLIGRQLQRPDQPQPGLWGTALAAGYGARMFDNLLKTARALRRPAERFTVSGAHAKVYASVYHDYLALRNAPLTGAARPKAAT